MRKLLVVLVSIGVLASVSTAQALERPWGREPWEKCTWDEGSLKKPLLLGPIVDRNPIRNVTATPRAHSFNVRWETLQIEWLNSMGQLQTEQPKGTSLVFFTEGWAHYYVFQEGQSPPERPMEVSFNPVFPGTYTGFVTPTTSECVAESVRINGLVVAP